MSRTSATPARRTRGRHVAPKVRRARLTHKALIGAGLAGALAFTSGAAASGDSTTGATFTDAAAVQLAVRAERWATRICVIWSNEARADAVFTIASHAPLGREGWTNIVDKRAATTVGDLAGCDVAMIAGEAWGVTPAARSLGLAWMAAGGKVLSTGNDTGDAAQPLPELVGAVASSPVAVPFGGAVPASAAARSAVSPTYPSWVPGAAGTYEIDPSSRPVTSVAAGATCVGTVTGHPEWCAAIARTNAAGGRWVHLHTKIGSLGMPGEVPAASAALTWLTGVA